MKVVQYLIIVIALGFLAACTRQNTLPDLKTSAMEATPTPTPVPSEDAGVMTPATQALATATPTTQRTLAGETPEVSQGTSMPAFQSLSITILYDNNALDPRLTTAWGFSALVEYGDHTLLFDTGGDGRLLMENMRILEVAPTQIDSVMLSHAHEDHTGGLTALLNTGIEPTVYLLPSFPSAIKQRIEAYTQAIESIPGQSIVEGMWTTGELGTMIPEQALIIQTEQGLVIITGCAHPGIVEIIEQARQQFTEQVRLVLGGFHLGSTSEGEIATILAEFRRLGVEQAAPCHCTGDLAIGLFEQEYAENFIPVGVGSVLRFDGVNP